MTPEFQQGQLSDGSSRRIYKPYSSGRKDPLHPLPLHGRYERARVEGASQGCKRVSAGDLADR